jgi:hypothetical protein
LIILGRLTFDVGLAVALILFLPAGMAASTSAQAWTRNALVGGTSVARHGVILSRTSNENLAPRLPWFRCGRHSNVWLITAPDAGRAEVKAAEEKLDQALVGVVCHSA